MKASIVALGATFLGLTAASPVTHSKVIDGRAVTVSATDLSNFDYYTQYASAAYCNVGLAKGTVINCYDGYCLGIEANKATIWQSVSGGSTDIEGFIALDPGKKQIVVAIRGSSSLANWLTNILFGFSSCTDLTANCKVHDGFQNAWKEISTATLAAVASAKAANPSYTIVATGHSLGAAVATIATAYLRKAGYSVDLYTYGSPRVGNDYFANFVSGQAGGEYRVTHIDDPVPRLPPILFGYRHTSVEYWLSTGTATTVNYSLSDIKVCEGIANTNCNAGTSGFDTDAHGYYLENMGVCSADDLRRLVKDDLSTEEIDVEAMTERMNMYTKLDIEYAAAINAQS